MFIMNSASVAKEHVIGPHNGMIITEGREIASSKKIKPMRMAVIAFCAKALEDFLTTQPPPLKQLFRVYLKPMTPQATGKSSCIDFFHHCDFTGEVALVAQATSTQKCLEKKRCLT